MELLAQLLAHCHDSKVTLSPPKPPEAGRGVMRQFQPIATQWVAWPQGCTQRPHAGTAGTNPSVLASRVKGLVAKDLQEKALLRREGSCPRVGTAKSRQMRMGERETGGEGAAHKSSSHGILK